MEPLNQRLRVAGRALASLRKILSEQKSDVVRDAAIQRFEYTFEAVWKTAQLYLRHREGLDLASPKSVIRGFGQVGLLQEGQVQLALAMADDRNLTAHTYDESLAEAIYSRLPIYARLMDEWLEWMSKKLQS